jgi:hypothetical protein
MKDLIYEHDSQSYLRQLPRTAVQSKGDHMDNDMFLLILIHTFQYLHRPSHIVTFIWMQRRKTYRIKLMSKCS